MSRTVLHRGVSRWFIASRRSPNILRGIASEANSAAQNPQAKDDDVRFPSQDRFARAGMKLTVEEALFLAMEAGVYTTQEVQLQIVRSPPFSPRERPFLIENFFEVADYDDNALMSDDAEGNKEADENSDQGVAHQAHPTIHGTLKKHFCPDEPQKFWHNGQEWLAEADGHGTRKRAAAHAVIKRGSGVFKVNGESDMYCRWPMIYNRFDVCQPFKLTGTACVFDVFVDVQGGGPSGQAGAARLAISRALLKANPACHDNLQRGFCLYEDTRQQWSKMPGKPGATSNYSWSRR
jgi:ribosomal protein S9